MNSQPSADLTVATNKVAASFMAPHLNDIVTVTGVAETVDYITDALQRSVLFLDTLRQRGDEEQKITARPMATVLSFEHEILMSGRSLPKPINYSLSRIVPPTGVTVDPHKRPVVVVDPRAGQGPGIGGFKAQSEIGEALANGHPVYFIGFAAKPEPGQEFLDIVEGQVKFFEHIALLHPDAPKPFAVGNCQAGYQTLMVAMLRPDLFGPCMVAGSPMSYWQGVRSKNPMRYTGGLLGGSWLTALTSDLANGKFDGTWLILNFDALNPANWLWSKQYDLYSNIDNEAKRYLEFEKWWGDFIQLNGSEIQFLADQLFIGDKLARDQLQSSDGKTFSFRNIASPIIVFTSLGDNISPPQQTLGWILDLYRNVEDVRANGQTIVYCLNQTVGHLAIFVSSKVGAKEDEEMIRLMDMIDCLPPGLYELVIAPREPTAGSDAQAKPQWLSRFELRSFDDIRALGRNSDDDDRAFATAARMSELTLSCYRTMWQPFVRAMVSAPVAEMARRMNPLRLSYSLFADSNPWMKQIKPLAQEVAAKRKPASPENRLVIQEHKVSAQIVNALDEYRDARDRMVEQIFYAFYGSPVVQAMLGINAETKVRTMPGLTPQELTRREEQAETYKAKLRKGGFDEALVRSVLAVVAADRKLDERCAKALADARQHLQHHTLAEYKAMVRDQFFVLVLEREKALDAVASMVPADQVSDFICRMRDIVSAGGEASAFEQDRLVMIEKALTPSEPVRGRQTAASKKSTAEKPSTAGVL